MFESISIEIMLKDYGHYRGKSSAVSFLLTFGKNPGVNHSLIPF